MSASLTDQAVRLLVERGFPMLPSKGVSKGPCVRWKEYQERLPTAEQIWKWGRKFDPERWGLVTGALAGIVVTDFDGDEGIKQMRMWAVNPHVRTGSGGFHWYLRHPGWRVPTLNAKTSKRSWPWKGLDIRGDGGFAVLLGSNNSGPYKQLRELAPDDFDAFPEDVRTFLRNQGVTETAAPPPPSPQQNQTAGSRRVDAERLIRKALELAPNGRNDAGCWLACQLRDARCSSGDAEVAIRNYQSRVGSTNPKGRREAYPVREAMASLREAYSRTAREPWKENGAPPQEDKAAAGATSREPGRHAAADAPVRKQKPRHAVGADDPESIGLYVGHTGEPLSRAQFARVPREVSADRRLKPRDVRVYGVLASVCWQGSMAQVGKRLIAKQACCAERLVIASLKTLEATGHIKKQPVHRGKRGRYVLLSSVFGQKQRADVEEIVLGPRGHRLATVRKDQGKAWNSRRIPLKSSPRRTAD
jgi:hypothetical protein